MLQKNLKEGLVLTAEQSGGIKGGGTRGNDNNNNNNKCLDIFISKNLDFHNELIFNHLKEHS